MNPTEKFTFTAGHKRTMYILMGAGAVGILLALLMPGNHHSRLWSIPRAGSR